MPRRAPVKQVYRVVAVATVVITPVVTGAFHNASIARFGRVITRVFDAA